MYLHGFNTPKVDEYDTLSSEDKWSEYYDVILANPPFFSPKGGIQPHKRFGVESKRAEVLFTSYILDHLKPEGRAGIIVPEGIIFQTGKAYKELRKQLVETALIGVVSLPAGIFNPYSAVKTSVLILDKKLSKQRDSIFFAEVKNDGFTLGAQRTPIKDNDLERIKEKISLFSDTEHSNYFKIVTIDEILNSKDLNLSSNRYDQEKQILSSFELVNIKDYASFERGTSKSGKDFIDGKVPVVAGGKKPATYCNESNREGNIITISSSGANAGFVNFYKNKIFATDCFTIRTKSESLHQEFLYCLLKNKQDEIFKMQTGGAQPHVYSRDFDNFIIPLPPLEVQQEIVDELEGYQKIIDGCKQVVENYRPTIDIDPSWEIVELGKACDVRDGTHDSPKYVEEGFPLVTSKNVIDGKVNFKNVNLISKKDLEKINKRSKVDEGDILMPMIGTIGRPTIVDFDKEFAIKNVALIKKGEGNIINEYIKTILDSSYFRNYLERNTHGSTQKFISLGALRNFPIPVADEETQKEIVQKIEGERKVIEGNNKLIEVYTQKIQDRINKVWGE